MGKRVISGALLVIVALAVIIPGGYILAGVSLILSLIAYKELTKCCGLAKEGVLVSALEAVGGLSIIAYYVVMVFVKDRTFLFLTLFLILMAFMFVYVFTFPKFNAKDIMMSVFCVFYGPLMLSFIYLTRELENGAYAVWMIFISSWICDTFAYFVGVLIGKHKMAPVLSPKKSIEGAVGGVLGAAVIGGLFAFFLIEKTIPNQKVTWAFVLIASLGAVISQVGDLAASGIKRNFEIKDYGKLIPGHGGVMDRFDSVIFTAPLIYFLTLLLIHG